MGLLLEQPGEGGFECTFREGVCVLVELAIQSTDLSCEPGTRAAVPADVVAVSQATELFLTGRVPHVEQDLALGGVLCIVNYNEFEKKNDLT